MNRLWNNLFGPTLIAALLLLAAALPSGALIKADFTPVHLVNQSTLIVELVFEPIKDGRAAARVQRVIKGKLAAPKLFFEFKTAAVKEHADELTKKLAAHGKEPVILFTTDDAKAGGGNPGQAAPDKPVSTKAYLHVDNTWSSFFTRKANLWELDGIDSGMSGTWQGGTDMLIRAVDYILTDPNPDVPAAEGVAWSADDPQRFAKIDGAVHSVCPIDLAGDGKLTLHIGCGSGDRLFVYDVAAKNLKEITRDRQLSAKSLLACWGDFNRDGRLDLASWDGRNLLVHLEDMNGNFVAPTLPPPGRRDEIIGLACVDSGIAGRAGVVVSTNATAFMWIPYPANDQPGRRIDLDAGEPTKAKLGKAGACLVADLDGDGLPDILQPFAAGSLIYRGKGAGTFEPPKECSLKLGAGAASIFTGDFDADGRLDIAVASSERCMLWQNRGIFNFSESLALCGEFAYKSNSAIVAAQTCDFNADGRQDLLLLSSSTFPGLFFNRGFRSFGYANALDLEKAGNFPAARDGQQAGCLADLKGDGSFELFIVCGNGECWRMPLEGPADAPRQARPFLSASSALAAPLNLTVWQKARCLGSWNLQRGQSAPPVASRDPGPLTFRWKSPDGHLHEQRIAPAEKPARIAIE
jgi:hypothetical protein